MREIRRLSPLAERKLAEFAARPECEWIKANVGTDKWVVAHRLTDRLRLKGYTVAIHPKRYRKLWDEYELMRGAR